MPLNLNLIYSTLRVEVCRIKVSFKVDKVSSLTITAPMLRIRVKVKSNFKIVLTACQDCTGYGIILGAPWPWQDSNGPEKKQGVQVTYIMQSQYDKNKDKDKYKYQIAINRWSNLRQYPDYRGKVLDQHGFTEFWIMTTDGIPPSYRSKHSKRRILIGYIYKDHNVEQHNVAYWRTIEANHNISYIGFATEGQTMEFEILNGKRYHNQ